MYLKKIKVRNFKSFAGTTEIPFQPGFTGVAGPNGMGKSNISDAILFVLGPKSSKALRADRLTHLFFNGGSSKKPATECEVSLVFDNKDRLLSADSDEVELTRSVKLAPNDPNGYYSYFYLNGRRSTQTEIDAVLSHARLSGDGYNLVQQGDVNQIVSMGPIPRRGLVERLAGITQYDEELARAEAKRVDLEANLDRIQTLLGEIRNHLGQLESQRVQAIQYKDLQDQKRRTEARLARQGHRLADQEVKSCEKQLAQRRVELEGLQSEVKRLETEQYDISEAIDKVEKEIASRAGVEAQKFKDELDARRMSFARLDENVRQATETLEGLEERVTTLAGQIQIDTKELRRLTKTQDECADRLAAVEAESHSAQTELAEASGTADQTQGKLVGARREILDLEQRLDARQGEWQVQVAAVESAKAAVATSDRDHAQSEDDHRTRELEYRDLEQRARGPGGGMGEKGGSAADLQKVHFQLKAKEKSLSTTVETSGREVLELNRQYMSLDARLKARTEGGAKASAMAAVDYLLAQRNLGKIPGIKGTVEELARFDPEHQTALQVAAGPRFQALVVETDQVAEECIRLLRTEKRGRATFLPLNKMLTGRPHGKSLVVAQGSGAVGFALDLVHFEESMRPAFWYVFGETVVMENLATARSQMGGVRLVTAQGDLIEATGAISGGYLELGAQGRGADNAAALKRLGDELRAKSAEESDARAELSSLSTRLRELTEDLAKRSGEAMARDSALDEIRKELTAAKDRLKEAAKRIADAANARTEAAERLRLAEEAGAKLSKEIDGIKTTLAQRREQYYGHLPGAVSARIRTLQLATQTHADARVAVARELEAAKAGLTAATQALETRQREHSESRTQLDAQRAELARLTKDRDESRSALDALREVETKQSAAVQAHTEKKRALDAQRLKIAEHLGRAQEGRRTQGSLITQEETRLAQARQHLVDLDEALKAYPEPAEDETFVPVDELKRTIQTLASQLEALGSVNLRALEEYDAEKSRLDEFEGETARLGTEKQELQGLVGEIEKKKRIKLVQVVDAVNTEYKQIYSDLSGGGEGQILLENPEDPLAGGLLIKASPVGKVVKRLEQLSGGEKSLASLALVFALQRYDPSPLYVFDEVDMSLDGINAENVGRMLRRNSERAQFIVISLRKVTLKFAAHLFGVTMHGDGCSRVVGLRLDELVDMEARERGGEAAPAASEPSTSVEAQ
ncbi:MAG: chromosome segregation protein SMC [Thermoplasmata archaeon]|nr:chromosome segregation protein SMC [Thermoplasmata archaeon]